MARTVWVKTSALGHKRLFIDRRSVSAIYSTAESPCPIVRSWTLIIAAVVRTWIRARYEVVCAANCKTARVRPLSGCLSSSMIVKWSAWVTGIKSPGRCAPARWAW